MKKIIIVIVILVLLGVGYFFAKPFLVDPQGTPEETISIPADSSFVLPSFTEATVNAPHTYDESTYAFRGSALIDIEGDGVDELWLAGGKGEADTLLRFTGTTLESIDAGFEAEGSTAAGAVSIDVDTDGDVDLIIAREDGLAMYRNDDGRFTKELIAVDFDANVVPFSLAVTDFDKDGWVDLYVSTFIAFDQFRSATFNDPANRSANVMLRNNGDNTFSDVTEEAGLAFAQNTFQAAFVDLDNDTWQDLVLAINTDRTRVYKNNTDGTFTAMEPIGDYGFWMGLGVADYDNDGDQDVILSNSGQTVPQKIARGDLRDDQVLDPEWRLYRNDGDFRFSDVTEELGLTQQSFAWGALFGDANLDGLQDLSVVENYVKWPAHKLSKLPGSFFLQKDGTFERATKAVGAENAFYGTTPLFTDLTQDGYPELLYVNMDSPTRLLVNDGGAHHFVTLAVPDTVEALGLRAELFLSDGTKYSQQRIVGQGLMTDTSADLTFGLGNRTDVERIEITWPSGAVQTIEQPEVDSRIIVEKP